MFRVTRMCVDVEQVVSLRINREAIKNQTFSHTKMTHPRPAVVSRRIANLQSYHLLLIL